MTYPHPGPGDPNAGPPGPPPSNQPIQQGPPAWQGQPGPPAQPAGWGGPQPPYPSGPFGPGGGPPGPRKNNTALIVVVAVAVIAVLGLVVVLASGDDDDSGGGGGGVAGGGGGEAAGSGDIEQFAAALASAIDQQDSDTLSAMSCPDASGEVQAAIEAVSQTNGAELAGTEEAGDGYVVTVDITAGGEAMPYGMVVVDQGEGFCVQDITFDAGGGGGSGEVGASDDIGSDAPPSAGSEDPEDTRGAPGGGGSTAEVGEEFVATFIEEVNQGDEETALGMMCSDSSNVGDVSAAIASDPVLEVDWQSAASDPTYVGADLVGTLGGQPFSSGSLSAFFEEDWCIYTFYVY